MVKRIPWSFLLTLSIALFWLQALIVIFSVMFGIIYDQIFAGSPDSWLVISNLLVLAAFISPLIVRFQNGEKFALLAGMVCASGRALLSINDAGLRFWGSLLVLTFGGIYLTIRLQHSARAALEGVIGAVLLFIFLRIAGYTYDFSLSSQFLPLQILWSAWIVLICLYLCLWQPPAETEPTNLTLPGGLAWGSWLFLETSLLALPHAAARWSNVGYSLAAPAFFFVTFFTFLLHKTRQPRYLFAGTLRWRLAAGVVLTLCLLGGYFGQGVLSFLLLLLAQCLAVWCLPALFTPASQPHRSIATAFAAGMAGVLFLNYFNAFAFTYPYALPFMRGLGWAVYTAAGLLFTWGLAGTPTPLTFATISLRQNLLKAGSGVLLTALVFLLSLPPAVQPFYQPDKVRIATYNIHYGYDTYWHQSLDAVAETIRQNQVDVVTLQEVDTGRLTSYAGDNAFYLAKKLGMQVVYLPTVEHLTGIAVLHRGSSIAAGTKLLPSLQEQTGIIHVQLQGKAHPFHVFGIWMGLENEDTLRQINTALEWIAEQSPAAFGGDFNAGFDSPVGQAVRNAGFSDPFTQLGIFPIPLTDPAVNPEKRIDFVWLRGLQPLQAWVPDSLASDHRMVVVEVELP